MIPWVDSTPRPGWQNMAIDQALLDLAEEEGMATLRLYRWDPFCLSFGRHEPARRRYSRERVEALGLDSVRRPTGGRAVWHARELTYAVAAPLAGATIRDTYLQLHATLLTAIRALGAEASLAGPPARTPGPADGACFDAAVGGEILVNGRKVAGSAQVRQGRAFLQHGAVLLEDDQRMVRDLAGLRGDAAPDVPLARALGRQVSFEEAARQVVRAFDADRRAPLDPDPVLRRADRHGLRFASPEWTWDR
jgi:lipoyl(octanoyl) transferase